MSFKLVEIQAPYLLPQGGNFFKQPPFGEMFTTLSNEIGMPEANLRTGVIKIAKGANKSWIVDPSKKNNMGSDINLERAIKAVSVVRNEYKVDLEEKWNQVIQNLNTYPQTLFYFATQHDTGVYNEDGGWNQLNAKGQIGFGAVDSYAWWITKHFSRLGRRATWPVPKHECVLTESQIREKLVDNDSSIFVDRSWIIGVDAPDTAVND